MHIKPLSIETVATLDTPLAAETNRIIPQSADGQAAKLVRLACSGGSIVFKLGSGGTPTHILGEDDSIILNCSGHTLVRVGPLSGTPNLSISALENRPY